MSKNKILKTGILLATLVLPVLVYLFLRFFSQNHFVLPRYIPKVDSLSGKVIFAKRIDPLSGKQITDTVFNTLPSFSLIDQDSAVFDRAKLNGKISIASFIFTRCGLICPKTIYNMQRVQGSFEENDAVILISYTVDPAYDKPHVLKKYAQKNEAIVGKWYFVTGTKSALYNLALKGYYVPVSDASEYNKAITNPDEAFIHTEKLVLLDKQGVIRGFYDGTDKKDIDRLMLETKILLDIYKKQKYAK
jgi:protein SCO1